jgi:predicted branched-subunit amino acid permease
MSKSISNLKFKQGVKNGLPIGLGYLSVSIAFGVKASLLQIPIWITVLISMTNLTSAGQLSGIEIIAGAGTIIEIILTQLVINSRYFLMSLTLTQKIDSTFNTKSKLLCSTFITDEIYAVASSRPQKINPKYVYGLALLPYIGWTVGTLIGATLGNFMPTFITSALGIALYAMFIAIVIPPAKKERGILFAVMLSTLISCAFYYIPYLNQISVGFATIISAVLTSLVIAYFFPIKEENEND